ncbi:FAD/NAD-P-binding domain-containing protein [Peniophora sp. CONT]|nr:FAD/NAD-P-binding domain-containing protein [Peniophora sp. CONT]
MTSSDNRTGKDFSLAIVGGGICGLTLAIALAKAGIRCDVFEAAQKYGEIGAGIGVGCNALRVLEELGLARDVAVRSDSSSNSADGDGNHAAMNSFKFVRGESPHDIIFDYPETPSDVGLGLHRASFLEALADNIDNSMITEHFKKRCNHIQRLDSGRIRLNFADGTNHETDVVIGADGLKSTVRRFVLGLPEGAHDESLVFTRTAAYRGLVPMDELRAAGAKTNFLQSLCWFGKDKHLITFPIRDNKILNVVAFSTDYSRPMEYEGNPEDWVKDVPQEEMLKDFDGWGPDVQAMLKRIKSPSKWSIHALYPTIDKYVEGKVALIGDAAHATLPHLGAGAGCGIEDAYVLARLLAHPQTHAANVEAVLEAYQKVRVPRGSHTANKSKFAGDAYDGHGPSGDTDEGRVKDYSDLWAEIWRHDLKDELQAAQEALTARGAFKSA